MYANTIMSSLYLRHEQNHVNVLHYFQYTVGYVVLLASKVPDYNCDFAQLPRLKKTFALYSTLSSSFTAIPGTIF